MQPTHQLIDLPTLDHVIDRFPLTVASDTPVVDAIALLDQAQADCVLVVEESQLVGVFIEQDVVRLTASGMDLSRLKLFEAITRQVIILTQSDSQDVFTAFSLMRQHRIRHLPIVDKHNHLVGLVTQTSLLQVFDPTAMYGVIEALQQQVAARTTELKEVASSQQIEALSEGQAELEIRVAERNSELVKVNQELQTTLGELQVNEEEVRANEELATASETAELERQRYQDLFKSAPDGYLLTNTAGIIQEANSVAAALLSVHQEYLVGKPLIVFIAKQDRKTFRTRLTNLQVVEDWELYIQPRRNKPLSASIRVAPVHDMQGKLVGLRWLIRDISEQQAALRERKRAEESLRENQRLTQRIVETTPEILYIHDLVEQRNTFINSQITEVLGYTSQEVQAMDETVLPNLVHPDDLARVTAHLKRFETLKEGEFIEIEYRMRHANREWHWLHSRETVFTKNADGLPVQILGAAQDITDRKLAELALQENELKFRAVFNSALDAIMIADDDGRYILILRKLGRVSGSKDSFLASFVFTDLMELSEKLNMLRVLTFFPIVIWQFYETLAIANGQRRS